MRLVWDERLRRGEVARSRLARRILIRKSWQMLGVTQKQPFSGAVKWVFYRTCGRQVKDAAYAKLRERYSVIVERPKAVAAPLAAAPNTKVIQR